MAAANGWGGGGGESAASVPLPPQPQGPAPGWAPAPPPPPPLQAAPPPYPAALLSLSSLPASPAAERQLAAVGAEVEALAGRAAAVRRGLAALAGARAAEATAAAAARPCEDGGGPAPGAPPLPSDVAGLAAELAALRGAQQYAQALQDVVALARHLDRHARAVERAVEGGRASSSASAGACAALDAAGEAVAAAAAAAAACEGVATLPATGVPAALTAHAAAALARSRASTDRLAGALRAALGTAAAAAGWPPPLVSGSGGAGGAGGGGGPTTPPPAWRGWAEHPAAGDAACRLVAALVALQRAVTPGRFARAGLAAAAEEEEGGEGRGHAPPAPAPLFLEGPPLWWAAELAAPLGSRLAALFTPPASPADAPDKPEWLFAAALRAAAAAAAGAAPLQPGLDAHGLGAAYGAGFEAARGVRGALCEAVLSPHVLPRLAALASPPLWIHFAEEAAAFERALAPMRGLGGGGGPGAAPEPWPPGSVLALVTATPAWRDAWWGAERDRAVSEVDAALDAPGAWEPAGGGAGGAGEEEDALLAAGGGGWGWGWGGGGHGGHAPASSPPPRRACQAEFWPPAALPPILAALSSVAARAGWLDGRATQRAYVAAVPRAALAHLRARLARAGASAAEYRDLAGPAWAGRVGALVCAARCVEHALREAAWPLVLLDEGTGGGGGRLSTHAHHHPSVLAAEADAAAAFSRKWALRLARAAADAFVEAAAPYKRAAAGRGGAFLLPPGGPAPAGPSPALLPALHALSGALDRLASSLDAVAFRDAWRAAAGGAVRFLFNDIATEGAFTPAGGAQFGADVAALAAVLGGVAGGGATTARPGAHVREAAEAAAVLAEADPGRLDALAAAAGGGGGGGGVEALRELGVTRLTPEQVGAVLGRRV